MFGLSDQAPNLVLSGHWGICHIGQLSALETSKLYAFLMSYGLAIPIAGNTLPQVFSWLGIILPSSSQFKCYSLWRPTSSTQFKEL